MGLEVGQVIDGKYRIVRSIGAGGMGVVYEGENILIRRRVAIKVMIPNASTSPIDAIRRFQREAQAAGQIGSDHILEVLDLGSLATGDHYMVMEYLDGETLAQRISRHIHLTPQQIAPIARQFLSALASAHAAGIIHRDLKPENIFILRSKAGRSDFVKLIDFGVSKFSHTNDGHNATRAGALLGTPCYMSPEQARGRGEADVRSDIYACGVILFEAVTGKLPFDGESFNDLMFKIALSETPSALTLMPSLDPDFAWIIERAMAKDPAERFQTVQEFAEKLDGWMRKNELTGTLAQPLPSEAFPPRQVVASANAATLVQEAPAESDHHPARLKATGVDESWAASHSQLKTSPLSRRRNAIIVAAAGLCAVVIAVVGTAALRSGEPASDVAKPLASTAPTSSSAAVVVGAAAQVEPPPSTTVVATDTSSSAEPVAVASAGPTLAKPKVATSAAPPKPKASATKPVASGVRRLDFGY